MEAEHAAWSLDALALLARAGPGLGTGRSLAAAGAWWAFLDEREALASAA